MIIYFTGTGNSKHCAEMIAAQTTDEIVNANELIKRGEKRDFFSELPFVFAVPTYSWQIPRIFEAFLKRSRFGGNRSAYFVMTCGGDIGCAARKNKKLCDEIGLSYKGTAEIKMPENYIAMFDVPDEKKTEMLNQKADKELLLVAQAIKNQCELEDKKTGFADSLKSGIVNKTFYSFFVNAKAFYADDRCISCGKCESLCPANTVKIKNGRPVWGEGCTHCMACISYCPTEAIEYGKKSVGKRRYRYE